MAHLLSGPAGPPPLGPDGFDWTVWHPDPTVVAGLLALGGLYVVALRRGRAQGLRAKPANVVSFFAGLPLLLYGTPGWMLSPFLRHPLVLRLGRLLTRPSGAFATFNLVLVAWHLPPLYNVAMEHHGVHIVQHLMIMVVAVILWWPVLSPSPELPRAPYLVHMLYLFVVGLPMVVVAIFITMADTVLYPYYEASPRVWEALTPHIDQHLGGLIMWIPGGLVFLIAISVVFFRWQAAGGDDITVAPAAGASHGR